MQIYIYIIYMLIAVLAHTPNQPSHFRTRSCDEINVDAGGTYNTNSHIKFKTKMLKSILFDYSNASAK